MNNDVIKEAKKFIHKDLSDEQSLSNKYRSAKNLIFQAIKMEEVQR
jgi:hypothetical protein